MKTTQGLLLACLGLGVLPGCLGRAISEGVGTVEGAKGNYTQVAPLSYAGGTKPLAAYTRFELGYIKDNFGGRVPTDLLAMLPFKFQAELARLRLPDEPGGRTLLVRGAIWHYEETGLFGNVFGPLEETIARIELVDKATGKVLGTANCIGRTRETVNLGVEKKAEGLALAIAKYIADNYR
jgi:hypothetical protein